MVFHPLKNVKKLNLKNPISLVASCLIIHCLFLPKIGAAKVKVFQTEQHFVKVRTLITGLEHPWGIAFLPDGSCLVTERSGNLNLISPIGEIEQILGTPEVWSSGQGGLLDVAVDPDFSKTRSIFLSFSKPFNGTNQAATTVLVAELKRNKRPRLENLKIIFSQSKPTDSGYHFGSRIVIAPDKTVFITVGDRGVRDRAQDRFDHAGSIIRINRDGSIPKDNPFVGNRKGLDTIWSIGHRNPQGAAWNPETNSLWTVEHGAKGGDEINQPEAGKNYGWPIISYGRHYWGGKIGEGTHKAGLEQPKYFWDPSIAPSGFIYYSGEKFPNWRGNFFVGALKQQMIVRLVVDKRTIIKEERIFTHTFGRIRDVEQGPDGFIYFLTDELNGKLMRIERND